LSDLCHQVIETHKPVPLGVSGSRSRLERVLDAHRKSWSGECICVQIVSEIRKINQPDYNHTFSTRFNMMYTFVILGCL
jgi:hypothetical protein